MAERFPDCDPKQLQELKENAENTNTKKSTKTWLTVWTTWAEEKGYSPDIVSYEAKELDEKLQKFFAEVRKKDGSDYEPDSLRVMLASLDRHLKEAGSKISIAKDREFVDSRKVLEGKARYLREQGYGKRPHASKALTTEDEELLWSKGLLGNQSPKSLIATMWFFLTQHFGLRGCQEHHDMFVEDFSFSKDDNGVEYVTYEENPTKTRQGGLRKKRRVVQPKMFATDGPRCPVKLLKTFLSHRPDEMKRSGPFYLAVIERPKSQVWYKRQRMGIYSINSFMKSMAAQAEIEGKKLTNHSARKTLVKKLKAANQPRSAIIGVTGHTNERSLADYEEGDENEQRLISSIISSDDKASTSNQVRRPLENIGLSSTMANTLMMNEEWMMTVNNFHGCQVTINYQLSQKLAGPKSNAPQAESIADNC